MEGKYDMKLSITELFKISRKWRKRYNGRLRKMQMWSDSRFHLEQTVVIKLAQTQTSFNMIGRRVHWEIRDTTGEVNRFTMYFVLTFMFSPLHHFFSDLLRTIVFDYSRRNALTACVCYNTTRKVLPISGDYVPSKNIRNQFGEKYHGYGQCVIMACMC